MSLEKFFINSITKNKDIAIIGKEKTGKSNIIFSLINLFIQKYDYQVYVCNNKQSEYDILIPPENHYKDCKTLLDKVFKDYKEFEETQKKLFYKKEILPNPNILIVLDDVIDKNTFSSYDYFRMYNCYKNISMVISVDNIDLIPDISHINYSFILKNDEEQFKNIYKNYTYNYHKFSEVISEDDFITTINKHTNDNYKAVIIQNKHFNVSKYKIKVYYPYLNQIKPKENNFDNLKLGDIIVIMNKSINRNKILIELINKYKEKYNVSNCMICSEDKTFNEIIPSNNIYNDYYKLCEDAIKHQEKEISALEQENKEMKINNLLVIIDKPIDDPYTLSKDKSFNNILYNGIHYGITFIICTDTLYNIPKEIYLYIRKLLLFKDEQLNDEIYITDLYNILLQYRYFSKKMFKIIIDKYLNENKVLYIDYNYILDNLSLVNGNCIHRIK